MTTVTQHTPGTPAWVDLMTPDLEKARAATQENPEARHQLDRLAQELELSSKP